MNWLQSLAATYETCADVVVPRGSLLWPISHVVKRAHVEIVLDAAGCYRRARQLVWSESPTVIPVTEDSAGRTSGMAPHPLCDELGYCADDCPDRERRRHDAYLALLRRWCDSSFFHPKARAVLSYVEKGTVWRDVSRDITFPIKIEDSKKNKTAITDSKVFVRWRIETPGDPASGTWEDRSLVESWISFDRDQNSRVGQCMSTGDRSRLAQNHPRFIRFPSDGAKLISANDFDGFTFLGRFTDSQQDYEKQTCSVGFETSQKAHSALRWLIGRQGYRSDDGSQAFVAWTMAGALIPDPWTSSEIFLVPNSQSEEHLAERVIGDAGQAFSLRLAKAIAGYSSDLAPSEDVLVIGVQSATPGRMSITFYRELVGSDFLRRLEKWHLRLAWHQDFGKARRFIGAPSIRDIAEAAFGDGLDEKLRKSTMERLLPCVIDGAPIPGDLVQHAVRHACVRGRSTSNDFDWSRTLGVACSLFKATHEERRYEMGLELSRTSRDYLFGRLLAIADQIESFAQYVADETKRDTNAARFMQRFADRPASTWRTLFLQLGPYMSRLRTRAPGALINYEKLLDEIHSLFTQQDFTSDSPLSGEFLLGFHCQRLDLRPRESSSGQDKPSDV